MIGAGFWGIEHFTPPWDVFFLPLFNLLVLCYKFLFSDFALAIIVFTIVIRTLLAPLFIRQIRSQKEMQRMQPLIKEVQRKHKGNRQKVSEETMALYKEHGVNPAAGCLPVVLQLPLLFALYQALIRASNVVTLTADQASSEAFATLQAQLPGITPIAGETDKFTAPINGVCNLDAFNGTFSHFLPLNCQLIEPLRLTEPIHTTVPWLFNLDLAKVDHVFAIPIAGFALSGIAILAAALQFIQVRMTTPGASADDPTAATTSTMTYLFPLMTIFWGGLFQSGLILYWAVYTAYLIVQQYTIMGWGNLFPIFGWRPRWAPPPTDIAPPRRKSPDDERAERGDRDERGDRETKPSSTRPGGSPGAARQQQQRPGRKRRGRRR